MTPEQYAAWQESIGRDVVVLCPWCGDWEDVEDAVFDGVGNFWCCWGCESIDECVGRPADTYWTAVHYDLKHRAWQIEPRASAGGWCDHGFWWPAGQ